MVALFSYPSPSNIHTLSLHDALPICLDQQRKLDEVLAVPAREGLQELKPLAARQDLHLNRVTVLRRRKDRKSTRLNSSHITISYAVFCLKKKTTNKNVKKRPACSELR